MKFPTISVILPIRNEAASIAGTLNSILAQDYPAGLMEILVVDGQSTDGTLEALDRFRNGRSSPPIGIMHNPRKIAATGLNIALREARGEMIVRVDAHTIIALDYVRQCVEALQETGADNVGGRMAAVGKNAFGRAVALATGCPFGVGGGRFHVSDKEEWVDTVYLGAWPRRVFDKNGLFDEELVRDQDDEFNYRLREAGGRILLSPKIRSEYTVRGSPSGLWRQYFEYGYWKVRVLQKHPRQMQWRQFVPPLFVAALLGSLALSIGVEPARRAFGAIAGMYLFANLSASVLVAGRRGWAHLPLLPLTFAILHVSYGLGFLVGLVRFWNRWGDRKGKVPDRSPTESASAW